MNRADVAKFVELNNDVRANAMDVLRKIHEADPKECRPEYLDYTGVDDGEVFFSGDEPWSYGDHLTYRFDLALLYDHDKLEKFLADRRKVREAREEQEKRQKDFMATHTTVTLKKDELAAFREWQSKQ